MFKNIVHYTHIKRSILKRHFFCISNYKIYIFCIFGRRKISCLNYEPFFRIYPYQFSCSIERIKCGFPTTTSSDIKNGFALYPFKQIYFRKVIVT